MTRIIIATVLYLVLVPFSLVTAPLTLLYAWRRRRKLDRWAGVKPGRESPETGAWIG